ncbi:MAG TPA: hypothetical protein H9684_06490 [Firmicutes bacterium]|nr:hypothetical protein [Bacillota bacterium]
MICPKCGKDFTGNYCPSCGRETAEESGENNRFHGQEPKREESLPGGSAPDRPDTMETSYIHRQAGSSSPRPSHWLRNALAATAILALLSAGAAVAAQQYGGAWGLRLPTADVSSVVEGTPYEETLPSGHYVVGVDIPAGVYTIIARKGAGRLFTAQGVLDAELVAEGGPETICGFDGVALTVGDTMTVTGMTVRVEGTANGSTSSRSNTATKAVTLAVLSASEETGTTTGPSSAGPSDTTDASGAAGNTDPAGTGDSSAVQGAEPAEPVSPSPAPSSAPSAVFTAGTDFPAGVYTVKALRGSGEVSAGAVENGGIQAAMSSEEEEGTVQEFRNVNLTEGLELTVTGLDIQLVPSL